MEEGKSVFISSCSRRQLARRRPAGFVRGRPFRRHSRAQLQLVLLALVAVIVALLVFHVGL
jgi:hypothetical protein